MRLLIAGSSGFLGTHLTSAAEQAGHQVTRLVRREPRIAGEVRWDPVGGAVDDRVVEQADVVVNLGGTPTAGNPHSKKWAAGMLESRVSTTSTLAAAISRSIRKPAFLAQNGISFYGDHGGHPLPESADSIGKAFLTEVTRAWQQAAQPAAEAGARVVVLRTAPVIDRASAPLQQQRLQFLAGLGGRIGNGKQYFPVISLRDWVGAVLFLAEPGREPVVSGPVNLCCPDVPTNAEYTAELARQLHRPALFTAPAGVVRRAAGRMAPEVLGSMRAVPQVLLDAGYEFQDPDIKAILRTALA